MKKTKFLLSLLLFPLLAGAQESSAPEWLNMHFEVRGDYQREYVDGETIKGNSGFKGKFFNIIINGTIAEKWTYSYRQRLNKPNKDATFFDATDWLHLTYSPTTRWQFSAGKQVVGIGGFEYDRAPIDILFGSEYWANIPCYRWGVSAAHIFPKGNDKLMFQVCTSPFDQSGNDMYAYNLLWSGRHEWFTSLYSINLLECQPGKYITYLTLGNQFQIGNACLQLDLMNRATDEHAFFFKDCSVIAELSYLFGQQVNVFGKVSYDVNRTRSTADLCVMPGTEITRIGGGVEYFPLKGSRNLRFHASGGYSFGTNSNLNGSLQDNQAFFNLGIKWRIDLIDTARKVLKI